MKMYARIARVFVIAAVIGLGLLYMRSGRSEYIEEIATARVLLRGENVSLTEYENFKNAGCLAGFDIPYFYRRAAEQGLDRKEVEELCGTVQFRALVVK